MLRKYTTKSRIYQKNRKKRRRFSVLVMLFFAIIIILCANKAGEKISDKINEIRYPVKFSSYIIKYSDKPLKGISEVHEETPYFGIDLPIE